MEEFNFPLLGMHGLQALQEIEFDGKKYKIKNLDVFSVAFELKRYIDNNKLGKYDQILVNGEYYTARGFFEILCYILAEDLETAYYLLDGAMDGSIVVEEST